MCMRVCVCPGVCVCVGRGLGFRGSLPRCRAWLLGVRWGGAISVLARVLSRHMQREAPASQHCRAMQDDLTLLVVPPHALLRRRVPFTTRRPTFSETKRVLRVLVTLYQLADEAAEGSAVTEAGGGLQGTAAGTPAEAAAQSNEQQQQKQQRAAAAAAAAEQEAAAAAAAAAEEEARRKKAEKRARQKAKQKETRQAEAAASRAAAEAAARQAADDEIGLAAAAVAAMSSKLTAKPAPVSSSNGGQASAPPRLSAKPRANEAADVRRARLAAAAEARMKALQEAAKQQQLH